MGHMYLISSVDCLEILFEQLSLKDILFVKLENGSFLQALNKRIHINENGFIITKDSINKIFHNLDCFVVVPCSRRRGAVMYC